MCGISVFFLCVNLKLGRVFLYLPWQGLPSGLECARIELVLFSTHMGECVSTRLREDRFCICKGCVVVQRLYTRIRACTTLLGSHSACCAPVYKTIYVNSNSEQYFCFIEKNQTTCEVHNLEYALSICLFWSTRPCSGNDVCNFLAVVVILQQLLGRITGVQM